jgi:hypothetical protein
MEGDKYIYEESLDDSKVEQPFTKKTWLPVYDVNGGTYTNQIIFSTKQLVGNGSWVDLQNSYIEIPLVIAMKGGVDISAAGPNSFSAGLKDGSFQIVDYIQLSYNGTSIAQQSSWSNLMINYKILSSWSQEDLYKYGDRLMVAPDSALSSHYSNNGAASAWGDGTSNNQLGSFIPSVQASWSSNQIPGNDGYLRRLQNCSFNGAAYNGLNPQTSAQGKTVARNYFGSTSDAGAAKVWYWSITATIRAKDLHDWFNKVPLLLSSQVDLIINLNTCNGTIAYVNGTDGDQSGSLQTLSYNQTSGHCCPFMVSGASTLTANYIAQPNAVLGANMPALTPLVVGCGVASCSTPAVPSSVSSISNCRWMIPLLTMNPVYQKNLFNSVPTRTVRYDDYYSFASIKNANGSFTQVLTSGVKNPKYLIMFPFYSSAKAYSGNNVSNACYQSFFDSAPGTTSPQISLTNFQVELGGNPIMTPVETYDYQFFLDEFTSINALNGGKSPIETSGLITGQAWNNNQRIYVANLSRRLDVNDGAFYSVQVSGTVNSQTPDGGSGANVDFICFVVYSRECVFEMETGALLNTP